MMAKKDAKTKLNPSLAITFLIVSVTGIMMLFHAGGRGLKHMHEWMGIVFLIMSIIHLSLNWKSFWANIKHGPIVVPFIAAFLLLMPMMF
ncbi:MAG: DUF4405 domain-containing protein [Pseudomonadota bacterium]